MENCHLYIYTVGDSHEKWWFSIAMLVWGYQHFSVFVAKQTQLSCFLSVTTTLSRVKSDDGVAVTTHWKELVDPPRIWTSNCVTLAQRGTVCSRPLFPLFFLFSSDTDGSHAIDSPVWRDHRLRVSSNHSNSLDLFWVKSWRIRKSTLGGPWTVPLTKAKFPPTPGKGQGTWKRDMWIHVCVQYDGVQWVTRGFYMILSYFIHVALSWSLFSWWFIPKGPRRGPLWWQQVYQTWRTVLTWSLIISNQYSGFTIKNGDVPSFFVYLLIYQFFLPI